MSIQDDDIKLGYSAYIVGVGSAFATTMCDAIRNDTSSALTKAATWFYRFGPDRQALWTVVALLFFCIFAALIVFAYTPRSKKEAFVLGAGIISLFNATFISPLAGRSASSDRLVPNLAGIISDASAQASDASSPSQEEGVWFFVDGPKPLRHPETRVVVYSAETNRLVTTRTVFPTFRLNLSPGEYFIQIDHTGFRSAISRITVGQTETAYSIKLTPVSFSSISNLLGAENVDAAPDEKLAASVEWMFKSCRAGITDVAALKAIGQQQIDMLRGVPEFAPCFR